MANPNERQFQNDIIASLTANGWQLGTADQYDRHHALYTADLLAFVQTAYPDRWQKFVKNNPANPEKVLIDAYVRAVNRDGVLYVLRNGFKVIGGQIDVCAFMPDHRMNPDTQRRYQHNCLRVVQEVSYSPHARSDGINNYNPRLDLVLFVNGIPTATLELKSEFKQTVEAAKQQYKKTDPPKTH